VAPFFLIFPADNTFPSSLPPHRGAPRGTTQGTRTNSSGSSLGVRPIVLHPLRFFSYLTFPKELGTNLTVFPIILVEYLDPSPFPCFFSEVNCFQQRVGRMRFPAPFFDWLFFFYGR